MEQLADFFLVPLVTADVLPHLGQQRTTRTDLEREEIAVCLPVLHVVDFYLHGLGLLVMSPVQLVDLESAPLGLGQRHLQLLREMLIRAFHNGNHGFIFGVQQQGWGLWAALRKGRLHQLVHGA